MDAASIEAFGKYVVMPICMAAFWIVVITRD